MIKIMTYIDRVFDKKTGYSRAAKDDGKKHPKRIYAEDELDELLKEGWKIEAASTSELVTGVLGNTTSFSKLTVILSK